MSMKRDLREQSISRLDLTSYVDVESGAAVCRVLDAMREHRVSAVLVRDAGGGLAGIFTERDVLLKIVDDASTLSRPVDDFMTRDPQVLTLDDPILAALELMNRGHYRNVPIVDGQGHVVGNLSQHALVLHLTDRFPEQIYNLPPDPRRVAPTREGA